MAEPKSTKHKAAAKKPAHEKVEHETHVHEKPAHEKAVHEKPVHEKVEHETHVHEKPAHEKPVHEKAEHETHVHEKPAHEKAASKKHVHSGKAHVEHAKPKAKEESQSGEEEPKAKEAAEVKESPKPKAKAKPKKKKEVKQVKEHPAVKIKNLPNLEVEGSKKTKPAFHRQEFMRYKKLDQKWRAPTGIDSKKLEKKRGKGNSPSIGYKKPHDESEMHYGFRAVRVFNADGLKAIDSKVQAAVIASAVGRRKRNMIIEEANRLNITIMNPRRGEA
jgi:large subunit ribosomal protein L32e